MNRLGTKNPAAPGRSKPNSRKMAAEQPRLLFEALEHWVKVQPDKVVYTYLKDDGSIESSLTYKALDIKTAALAGHLTGPMGLAKV